MLQQCLSSHDQYINKSINQIYHLYIALLKSTSQRHLLRVAFEQQTAKA